MDGRQRKDHRRCRAVWLADDALVPREVVGVDLRDDERDCRVHAVSTRVIDDEAPVALGNRCVLLRSRPGGGEEDDIVRGRKAGFAGLFDRDLLSPELDHLPGGAGSSEEAKALHRGLAGFKQFQEFAADNAGAADHGDVVGVHRAHSGGKGDGYGSGRRVIGSLGVAVGVRELVLTNGSRRIEATGPGPGGSGWSRTSGGHPKRPGRAVPNYGAGAKLRRPQGPVVSPPLNTVATSPPPG